ncbi:MAG: mechanosensitive ion channel domain-containing protein [Myxococcota bacterium]
MQPDSCFRRCDVRAFYGARTGQRRTLGASCGLALALGIAFGLALASPAFAQNPIVKALQADAAPNTAERDEQAESDERPELRLVEVEAALVEARERQAILERPPSIGAENVSLPSETMLPSEAAEQNTRLIRVLEQRREALLKARDLEAGRAAIESGLARDPSELFGTPPPFPVPILDGVRQAWRSAVQREEQNRDVVEDRRANVKLAKDLVEKQNKNRRRIRDALKREGGEVERIRLSAELRAVDDQARVAEEQAALAEQRLNNATVELEIEEIASTQAKAALTWVENHLAPRDADLAEAIERLDRIRLELEREIEIARARLSSAENTLRAVEERAVRLTSEAQSEFEAELQARSRQLAHRQRIVTLLSARIERISRMRTAWQHRYRVLSDEIDLALAPKWRTEANQELNRLTRLRRIEETELAQIRNEITAKRRQTAKSEAAPTPGLRFATLEIEDLESLAARYQTDLSSIDEAIGLEERLRAELSDRIEDRDMGERLESLVSGSRAFWDYEITTSGESPITPGKIVIALLVFAAGFFFARIATGFAARRVFPRLGFDSGASNAFASLARYALLAAAFLFALRVVNIPLTGFAVAGGAIALGIGFGSQAVVSNFISGLLLLAERPIRTGDLVEINHLIGVVESIGLRSTRIRTADNFHIIVPNAAFLESNVINWTHQDPKIRMRVGVGVAYGSNARKVQSLLVEAASELNRTLKQPAPAAYFRDFGDSALLFDVRFWIRYDAQTDRPALESEVRFRISELFEENGIEIAYPQIDVHLDAREPEAIAESLGKN